MKKATKNAVRVAALTAGLAAPAHASAEQPQRLPHPSIAALAQQALLFTKEQHLGVKGGPGVRVYSRKLKNGNFANIAVQSSDDTPVMPNPRHIRSLQISIDAPRPKGVSYGAPIESIQFLRTAIGWNAYRQRGFVTYKDMWQDRPTASGIYNVKVQGGKSLAESTQIISESGVSTLASQEIDDPRVANNAMHDLEVSARDLLDQIARG